MLYEVITIRALDVDYLQMEYCSFSNTIQAGFIVADEVDVNYSIFESNTLGLNIVITSYSIHYTKLYEMNWLQQHVALSLTAVLVLVTFLALYGVTSWRTRTGLRSRLEHLEKSLKFV